MADDFHQLYRQHYGRVLGLCRRLLGGHAQAEDATQDAFLRAYRAMHRYDRARPFGAWMLEIAGNHCIDLLRRRGREGGPAGDPEEALAGLEDGEPGALDTLVAAEQADSVRAAIDALPDRYRVPLVLAYYADAGYHDIARQLGITPNHVGVLLLRARRALRQALTDRGDAP